MAADESSLILAGNVIQEAMKQAQTVAEQQLALRKRAERL